MTDTNASGETQAPPPDPQYPKAAMSLMAARKIVGRRSKGSVKFVRRFVSGDVRTWRAEAKLVSGEGIDYEIEVEGESADEVAYTLLSTLEEVWTSLEEE